MGDGVCGGFGEKLGVLFLLLFQFGNVQGDISIAFPASSLSSLRTRWKSSISNGCKTLYTLSQNGRDFSILLFDCKLALFASFKVKDSFEFYV